MRRLLVLMMLLLACGPKTRLPPAEHGTLDVELAAAARHATAHPNDPVAARELGWLALLAGDRAHAEAQLDRVVALRPDDARAHLGLALLADLAADDDAMRRHLLDLADLGARSQTDAWAWAGAVYAAGRLADLADFADVGEARARLDALTGAARSQVEGALLEALRSWTDRGPDEVGAATLATLRGCVPSWRLGEIANPAAHLALLLPPERVPMATAATTRAVATRRCSVVARPSRRRPAVVILDTWIASAREQEVDIELRVDDVDALARLWIGDGVVLGRDSARRFLPRRITARVKLGVGPYRVAVELASYGTPIGVEVTFRDPATGRAADVAFAKDPAATTRPAGAQAKAARYVSSPPPIPDVPATATLADGLILDLLLADAALARGDADGAGEAMDRVLAVAPRCAVALEAAARLALSTPARPEGAARDDARQLLARALAVDARAARARLGIAELLLADEDPLGALELLDAEPAIAHWWGAYLRVRALAAKGLDAGAEAALADGLRLAPAACPLLGERLRTARAHGEVALRRELAEKLVLCDGDSEALAQAARDVGDHEVLVAERTRLLARAPDDSGRWIDLGRAFLAAGEPGGARERFAGAVALDPWDPTARLALADVLASQGDVAAARTLLEEGTRLVPEARDLGAALVALGGADPIEAWRIDGRAVIRAFEADEKAARRPKYDAPAALVLDRTVIVLGPDGSRLTLTHVIVKVLEKEGLERWGEINVPSAAEPLRTRTIKADGTTREPESFADKEGLSAPDLAVGDYVEIEFVQVDTASLAWRNGFLGDRFYFASFEAPLDRTELVVVAPADVELAWDVRGDAPAPLVEALGDRVRTTFAARGRAQLVGEPGGTPANEWVGSVRPYAGVDVVAWRAWAAEQTFGARRADRAVRALARKLVAGKPDAAAKARALYAFVTDKIEDGGALYDEPSMIVARREGRRVILLAALCEAVGLPAELLLARPRTAGEGVPDDGDIIDLSHPVLLIHAGKQDLLADPSYRYAPLGWVVPALRGAVVLPIPDAEAHADRWHEAPRVLQLPADATVGEDRRELELTVELAADGSARIRMVETLTGTPAVGWRDYLRETPADLLDREVEERALAFHFPGVTLRTLAIQAREDADRPLIMTYEFDVPRYARAGKDGRLEVPITPITLELARRFVLVGARTTPLLLEPSPDLKVYVKVRMPKGYTVGPDDIPAAATLSAPGDTILFSQKGRTDNDGFLSLSEAKVVPLARVPVADYEAFTRACAAIDAEQARTIIVRPE